MAASFAPPLYTVRAARPLSQSGALGTRGSTQLVRPAIAFGFRRTSGGRRKSSKGFRVCAGELNTDKTYNCVVNKDGVIVADDIPSGVYEVSAWWAGGQAKDGETPLAPRCDSERQRGCEVRCEMTAEGELVCEGLSSGTYRVVNAAEYDATCNVEDGSFECTASWDEETSKPIVMDTGDLKMKETPEEQSFRMGG